MARYPGHPHESKSVKCADCEQEFCGDERIYIRDGDTVCADCLKERLLEAYSIDDLADAFDIRKTAAGDYLEESEEDPYDGD